MNQQFFPTISMTDGPIISLEQMLQARDQRVENQKKLLTKYKKSLVSFTLVIPGAIKSSSAATFIFDNAISAFTALCTTEKWPILAQEKILAPTGSEILMVMDIPAQQLKHATVRLEDNHPLGRLWDFDIICPDEGPLSRHLIGAQPRPCLICNETAHACSRARKHTLEELQTAIIQKINFYQNNL